MNKRKILVSSMGNILEWYDFGLFIFMAPIIGANFFSQSSANLASIDAFLVFSIGFLCRPLGGIFWGYFGDTKGRAQTLRYSILVITVSTLLVGFIPSYETIGIIAPILFIFLRLIQGISIGGEYSGIMIYLAEIAPQKKRGFVTSFAASGANLGFLLATLTFVLLNFFYSAEAIKEWAWRLPFILIGIPGSLIIYFRFKLSETSVYTALKNKQLLESMPFITAIKYAPYQLLKILGITCMSSTFYYFFVGYMPTYLNHIIGFSLNEALILQSMVLIAMLFFVPLAGILGDYFSRKKMLIITIFSVLLLIFPCFYLLQSKSLLLTAIALGIVTILSSLDQGNNLSAMVENCPENVRYSGIAFTYNLGNALFGGTTPLIAALLINNFSLMAPSYYLFFMATISLITVFTLLKHNQSMAPIAAGTKV